MKNDFIKKRDTAFMVTGESYRKYLSGIDIGEGIVIVSHDKICYFTDGRYIEAAEKAAHGTNLTIKLYTSLLDVKIYLKEEGLKKLGIVYDEVTLSEYKNYKSLKVRLFDASDILKSLRSVKTENEISNIKKACEITEKAFYKTIKKLKVGVTETEIKTLLENEYFAMGADGLAFDTIVAFGKNSAVPHHVSGSTKLKENDVVLVDTGCRYNGYCSDYTRTLIFGEPTEEFISAYNAVKDTNELSEEFIKLNVKASDADGFARENLSELGYEEYFTHSLGHGLGLEIHESPYLSKRDSTPLKENMVFTVEPGVYFKGKFGIRIEDTVIIQNGKVKRLFSDKKELLKIKI